MRANSHPMEHRWGSRVPLHVSALIRTGAGESLTASIRDASISGAFVETALRLPLLARVLVRPLADTGEWLDGCVVRVEGDGLALEWSGPGLHAVATLLAQRHGDALALIAGETNVVSPHFMAWRLKEDILQDEETGLA